MLIFRDLQLPTFSFFSLLEIWWYLYPQVPLKIWSTAYTNTNVKTWKSNGGICVFVLLFEKKEKANNIV